jgi:hypothetical protein
MTPTEAEAEFIALWQQGAGQQELASHLGVPMGTIKSRASALARQGTIQARPKGGAYPRQQAQARALTDGSPPDQTRHTGAHPGTPPADPTAAYSGTPAVSRRHTGAHRPDFAVARYRVQQI